MSVQKVNATYAIETICPIVINTTEAIFTYQMASTVSLNKDVNGRTNCFPTDFSLLQLQSSQNAYTCCENNALKSYMNKGSTNLYR